MRADILKAITEGRYVRLTDGRRGYFYTTRLTGNRMFQPVDPDGFDDGDPELVFDEHEVEEIA